MLAQESGQRLFRRTGARTALDAARGSDLGGDFCPRNGMIFNEVLALKSSTELADFAAGKNLVPTSVEICTPMASGSAAARKAAGSKKK